MVAAALIAVGVLAILNFVLVCVVVELFRDVRQIREAVGILDRPLTVELGPVAGGRPSAFGLPQELDEQRSALVLFLSDRCMTCRIIAASLNGSLPAGLWIVVEAATGQAALEFISANRLTGSEGHRRVIVDPTGAVAGRLGLKMSPVAYSIEQGAIKNARTVPSVRYLASIMPIPSEAPVSV